MSRKGFEIKLDEKSLSLDRLLRTVPVVNRAATVRTRGEGLHVILPIRRRWWTRPPFSWVLPYREHRTVALDSLGKEVYQAVNGRRSVEQIVEHFAKKHRLRFHEARLSVMQFLKMLAQRNIVILAIPKSSAEDPQWASHQEQSS